MSLGAMFSSFMACLHEIGKLIGISQIRNSRVLGRLPCFPSFTRALFRKLASRG
jgi:hypothetical protein